MAKRVKTSAVLKSARTRIASGVTQYICIAVEEYGGWEETPAVERTLRLIHSRMQMGRFEKWTDKHRKIAKYNWDDPYYECETSLEWWLVWKGHVKASAMPTREQMRQYRLAWMDELIREFKAKGD